jgi:hypothetical protein
MEFFPRFFRKKLLGWSRSDIFIVYKRVHKNWIVRIYKPMFISQAYSELLGRPDLFAWRLTGEVIQVSNLGRILDVRAGRPRRFIPKGSDLMSNDWRVGDVAKLRKELLAAQPEAL